jgi:methyl-accepting chemotaxis protein
MTLKLRHKVTGLALLSALLPVLTMIILLCIERANVEGHIVGELDSVSRQTTRQIVTDVYQMCRMIHDLTQGHLERALRTGRERLDQAGQAHLDETRTVTWQPINQSQPNKPPSTITLPRLMFGDLWLGQNASLQKPTPIVDEVLSDFAATATVFQRMNEQGDMLRVATNVKTPDGRRAIGTYIPAVEPDGRANRVIQTVMNGETYRGFARVTGIDFLSMYEPIYNPQGRVIGMWFVGVPLHNLKALRESIMNIKVGKTGYVGVVNSRGDYVVSKGGQRDGENILDARDSEGRYFIREMVTTAQKLQEGEVAYMTYPWQNPGEDAPREKLAAYTYFRPWDWVIVAGMYESDFYAAARHATASLDWLFTGALIDGVVMLLLVGGLGIWLGGRIARPISRITRVASVVAGGNLQQAEQMLNDYGCDTSRCQTDQLDQEGAQAVLDETRADETTLLLRAITIMTCRLNSLVGQVKHSCVQLLSSATEIAATSKQQEGTVSELGTSTNEIAASVKQITATSQDLVETMGQVSEMTDDTTQLAQSGREGLDEMTSGMEHLAGATQSISSKLSVINDKANNINTIVDTINKVADQTNLLSLNAAIEAEKAGEQGLGFSVVAREIRRLADQTAVATLDIEQMVKEMQSAVSSGVMEMDKFTESMRTGRQTTGQISDQLNRIIQQVEQMTPRFNTVEEGMQSQSQGAQQINEAMMQLTDGMQNTLESIREFNKTTDFMREAVDQLREEIERFNVSE